MNYRKVVRQVSNVVVLALTRPLSESERQGLIQAFEFTHELAWNVMKDYFIYQSNTTITAPGIAPVRFSAPRAEAWWLTRGGSDPDILPPVHPE